MIPSAVTADARSEVRFGVSKGGGARRGRESASAVDSVERPPKVLVDVGDRQLVGGNWTQLPVYFEGLSRVVARTDGHEVVHGELNFGHRPDDLPVRVGQAVRSVRAKEKTHRRPAVRQLGPTCLESSGVPVDDAADAAAMPEKVGGVEVPVREDVP